MNKVIITGHPCSAYEEVEELLRVCGMANANQSIRESFTPQQITQTLCKAHGVSLDYKNIEQVEVGAVWHSMVLDLMLANIDHLFWGWSDPNIIYLLNFWKSIDPNIVFILVYDKPESVFTHYDLHPSEQENIKERLNAWSAYNTELLSFYLKNQDRCLLVHAKQVRLSAASYIQQLKIRISKNLKFPNKILWKGTEISCPEESPKETAKNRKITQTVKDSAITLPCVNEQNDNPLSRYIAKALTHNNRQSAKIYKELQENANLPLINDGVEGIAAIDAWQAMVEQAYKHQVQTEQIQTLTEQLTNVRSTLGSLENEISKTKTEYEAAKNNIETLKQEQENLQNKLTEQNKKADDTEKQLQQAKKSANDKAEQLEVLQNRLGEQSKKADEIEKQKRELNQNLQQIEKTAKEKAEQLEQLKKQLEETKKAALEKEKQAKELDAKNKELQTNSQTVSQTELEQENEMLLSQLHQIQEELERYYLENQELKKNTKPIAPKFYGAKERVKNTLEYRIGGTMIEHWKYGNKLTLLSAVKKVQKEYKNNENLPPLENYADIEEGYKTQKHLSYRLGVTWLNHKNILTLPKAILKDVREFRREKLR